jgi:hypothetical protein
MARSAPRRARSNGLRPCRRRATPAPRDSSPGAISLARGHSSLRSALCRASSAAVITITRAMARVSCFCAAGGRLLLSGAGAVVGAGTGSLPAGKGTYGVDGMEMLPNTVWTSCGKARNHNRRGGVRRRGTP